MITISNEVPEDPSLQKPVVERKKILRIVDDEYLRWCLTDSLLTKQVLLSPNIHNADFSILESFSKLDDLVIGRAVTQSER